MISRTFCFLLMSSLLLCSGCTKKNTEPGNDCLARLDFTRITATDEMGNQMSSDPTDWTNDSVWCDQEYSLFNTSNIDLTGSDTSKVFIILFPNPLTTVGDLVVIRKKICPFQCVIVNKSLQVLDTFSIPNHVGNTHRILHFSDSTRYRRGEYYRIYYAAHCSSQMFFFRGHGDFKVL